jgi:multiple sugar transport system permease protein
LKKRKEPKTYLLVMPIFAVILSVVIFPLIWAIFISFHEWNPTVSPERKFIGFGNFIQVFTDHRFLDSLKRLLYYSGFGVILQVFLGMAIALILVNYVKSDKLRGGLLILYLVPMMMAPVVVGQIWVLLVTGTGTINNMLISIGLSPVAWRGKDLALTTVMLTDIWQWTALPLLIIYAGRISIPENLYEAAYLDGASDWMIFRRITLPYLTIPLAIAFLLRFMDSYKYLDKVFIMTYGGPGTASELPVFYTFLVGFSYYKVGYAAALGWIIGLAAVFFMLLFWKIIRRRAIEGG